VTPDARELHRVITASVRELLETARLEMRAGAMDAAQVERPHLPRRRAHRPQRDAVDRGAARRAAPEHRSRDVGRLPGGASAMTAAAQDLTASNACQDLARLLEGPGEEKD
jgi:hypothetical protein